MQDVALETLFRPFAEGRLSWPESGALFLRARDGWPLREHSLPGLVCEQTFKPEFDALKRAGFSVQDDTQIAAKFPLVLLLPPRQRAVPTRPRRILKPGELNIPIIPLTM